MGYYTEFTIDFNCTDATTIEKIGYAIGRCLHEREYCYRRGTTVNAKFYTFNEDMTDISKQFPGIKFTVDGVGDERNDIWENEYLDGVEVRKSLAIVVMVDTSRRMEFMNMVEGAGHQIFAS